MAIKSNPCKLCSSTYHTAAFCPKKPNKPIKSRSKPLKAAKTVSKPRKKSTPRKLAKDKAWAAFSIYIRTRDCLRFTGEPTQGMCVTCKAKKPFKELQAGHFVAGRGNAVLFNEQVVYSQCSYCNQKPPMGLGGNYAAYTLFMFDEGYTRKEIEAFLALKGTTKQYKLNDFIEIEAVYKAKTKDLI